VVSDDRTWAEFYLIKSCMQDCISVELPTELLNNTYVLIFGPLELE